MSNLYKLDWVNTFNNYLAQKSLKEKMTFQENDLRCCRCVTVDGRTCVCACVLFVCVLVCVMLVVVLLLVCACVSACENQKTTFRSWLPASLVETGSLTVFAAQCVPVWLTCEFQSCSYALRFQLDLGVLGLYMSDTCDLCFLGWTSGH